MNADPNSLAPEHTCRDEGYTPYVAACRGCAAQLSRNGAEHTAKRRSRSR